MKIRPFFKTLSEYIDPILSCTPQTMEENNVSTNIDGESNLEITGFMQKNSGSANCENTDDDSDIEITGFIIPSTAQSVNTNTKKAGYIPIKIKNNGINCSRDEINYTLSPGDETGKLVICWVRWQTKINISPRTPINFLNFFHNICTWHSLATIEM